METVFITIHDLSPDARIQYCSDSVEDILGYLPHEVKGKPCWEYFHPDEIPFAKAIHGRGLALDKAASLNYCRVQHKDGHYVGCECVFTVVHDVLIASTAIYQRGHKAQQRAADGANIRRIFASSPRDPRYHMLSYISDKFAQPSEPHKREPRAALILNRFTRTSTIMFATKGVEQILGLQPKQLVGKSFYYCVVENCLLDAVRTIESAKGNDSIAYLRFFFRDPCQPDPPSIPESESASDVDDDGGVPLSPSATFHSSIRKLSTGDRIDREQSSGGETGSAQMDTSSNVSSNSGTRKNVHARSSHLHVDGDTSRASSGNSTDLNGDASDAIFDPPSMPANASSVSSVTPNSVPTPVRIEIEAVVSCTSDGMVVVLRRALPMVPENATHNQPSYPDGLFASPWALDPILPDSLPRTTVVPHMSFPSVSEPTESGLMAAIRDVAVFAWSLTGINGSLAEKAHGKPRGEALPPGGLPIWDPNAIDAGDDWYNGFSGGTHRPLEGMSELSKGLKSDEDNFSSSEDEILWKRVPQMPAYKKPKRKRYYDTPDIEMQDGEIEEDNSLSNQNQRRKLGDGSRGSSV